MKMFSVDRTVYMFSAVRGAKVINWEDSKEIVIIFLDGTRITANDHLPGQEEEYQYLCEMFCIDPETGHPLI